MAVLLDTSIGELVIDLYIDEAPIACENFLKLCKIKIKNFLSLKKTFKENEFTSTSLFKDFII
jgi:peptidyl-prolyl cis-trans isomerase-like 4